MTEILHSLQFNWILIPHDLSKIGAEIEPFTPTATVSPIPRIAVSTNVVHIAQPNE